MSPRKKQDAVEETPIRTFMAEARERVDAALGKYLPRKTVDAGQLNEAMSYSVFAGGKRLRPAFCLLAGRLFDADEADCMPAACAVEMIHTYSLIHDDLPAMDDDDYRRGKLSCHKAFGEAIAILAGDGLLTLAFSTIARNAPFDVAAEQVAVLAQAAGPGGMVAGQVYDLEAEEQKPDEKRVERIHRHKTGALITGALELGAVAGRAAEEDRERIRAFGRAVGLTFQIRDDVLDVVSEKSAMGKTVGKDAEQGKMTYPAVMGVDASNELIARLTDDAREALAPYGERAALLVELAEFLAGREK